LYADGAADEYLRENHGLGVSELSLAGFALYAVLQSVVAIQGSPSLPEIGLTSETYELAKTLISQPMEEARERARRTRNSKQSTAYRPSVLRRYPIITVDKVRDISMAPLPQLILKRVTSGISFDLFGAPDTVYKEISHRFETYCSGLLTAIFPGYVVSGDFKYGGNRTPDVLITRNQEIHLVVECKSTGMTYDARFGEITTERVEDKISDIGKGIFQIWRFFSHLRRGIVRNNTSYSESFGMVVTLDDWFTMSRRLITRMFENAQKRCDSSGEEILPCDKRPIVLAWIEDIEYIQRACSEAQALDVLRAAHSKEYRMWHLPGVVDKLLADSKAYSPYAFEQEFVEQSWWKKIEAIASA
jgi:hypothetical protein